MARRVLLVRHGHEPADDRVVTWLTQAGFDIDSRKPFAGELLGEPGDDLGGTVVFGGIYNACETGKHSFLNEEYRWIDRCIETGVPVLGICQGAQMIAHHLGAWTGAREDETCEFGYFRVDPTAEAAGFMDAPLWVTQAHYHTFDLPDGAIRLAGNDTYENQAFRHGDKVFGLQFHPEVTIEGFRRWQNRSQEAYDRPGAQQRDVQTRLMHQHDAAQAEWFYGFLNRLFEKPS